MKLRMTKTALAAATIASALGFGAVSVAGVGVASAAPAAPMPMQPGQCGRNFGCWPGPNRVDQDWSVGSVNWWRGRPDKWWGDGDLPPWGYWGQPPAVQWSGPPPWVTPHPINYWGYNATPVWDDNFHGWGIWLFGLWIPIVGISGY